VCNEINLSEEQKKTQEFSYAISHDLGSAIRGVGQLTLLLENSIKEKLSEKERYWMELIRKSADKGQAMIDALAIYTRLVNDSNTKQTFHINQLIHQVTERCLKKEKNSESIIIKFDIEPIIVEENNEHLSLLLTSLVNNAMEYYPTNVEEKLVIRINFKQCKQWNTLSVEDNGIGLTEAQRSSMILPFKSVEPHRESMHLGMGLTYCQRISELSQGELLLLEAEPNGLKVLYRWPKAQQGREK